MLPSLVDIWPHLFGHGTKDDQQILETFIEERNVLLHDVGESIRAHEHQQVIPDRYQHHRPCSLESCRLSSQRHLKWACFDTNNSPPTATRYRRQHQAEAVEPRHVHSPLQRAKGKIKYVILAPLGPKDLPS